MTDSFKEIFKFHLETKNKPYSLIVCHELCFNCVKLSTNFPTIIYFELPPTVAKKYISLYYNFFLNTDLNKCCNCNNKTSTNIYGSLKINHTCIFAKKVFIHYKKDIEKNLVLIKTKLNTLTKIDHPVLIKKTIYL